MSHQKTGVIDERTLAAMPMFLHHMAGAVGEFIDGEYDREGIVYLRTELIKDGKFDIEKTVRLLREERNHPAVVLALKEVMNFNFNLCDTTIEAEDRVEFDCVWVAIYAFGLV